MNFDELTQYFANIELPQELRLDRATTQFNVADQVKILLTNMQLYPENWRHQHRLLKIKNALENPYNGPGIPRC
jgi:hypothetical protein